MLIPVGTIATFNFPRREIFVAARPGWQIGQRHTRGHGQGAVNIDIRCQTINFRISNTLAHPQPGLCQVIGSVRVDCHRWDAGWGRWHGSCLG